MENNNIRTMEFIGLDDWQRPTYKCIENDYVWKDLSSRYSQAPELYSSSDNTIDGEPDSPIKKQLKVVFKTKYEEDPYSFEYQMLDRLRTDCNYYLGNGNRYTPHLWAKTEQEHIDEMKRLYNIFPDDKKPEWLTWDQILQYEKEMCI